MSESESAVAPGTSAQLIARHGPLAPYAVELLLASRPVLDPPLLRRALAGASGAIDTARLPAGAFSFTYLDHRTDFKGRPGVPMMHLVTYAEGAGDAAGREGALQQTWDWPDPAAQVGRENEGARQALTRARSVLLVQDMPGLQREERLALFQRLVRVLVTHLPVVAVHWIPSQRIVDPAKLLAADPTDPISHGPVNVRMFKPLDAPPGTIVMDTLGLTAFGSRDLEVCARGVSAGDIAGLLYGYARQAFDRGDFMNNRDTVDGIGAIWRCHHGVAKVAPTREVVELRPPNAPTPFVEETTPATGAPRCPSCAWVPHALARWECGCGFMWNAFETGGLCPACDQSLRTTSCLQCDESAPLARWYA